jgi:hypothetical protein
MFEACLCQTYELLQEQFQRAHVNKLEIKVRSYVRLIERLYLCRRTLTSLVCLLGRRFLGVTIHVRKDQELCRET